MGVFYFLPQNKVFAITSTMFVKILTKFEKTAWNICQEEEANWEFIQIPPDLNRN